VLGIVLSSPYTHRRSLHESAGNVTNLLDGATTLPWLHGAPTSPCGHPVSSRPLAKRKDAVEMMRELSIERSLV
jgi:hypothetical protein